jgi:DOMON domain
MRRTGISAISVAVLLASVAGLTFAQQNHLVVSSTKPVVDGVVQAGEYTYTRTFDNQVTLYASRTEDTLYFAVVAPTSGWVAIGLGSKKMDGSTIFMGFVDTDGKPSFKTQLGKGKRHMDAPADLSGVVTSYAIRKAGGKTTLEVAVKADAFIKQGQAALDVIYAAADEANYTKYHNSRGSMSFALQ